MKHCRGAALSLAAAAMIVFSIIAMAITLAGTLLAYNRVVQVASEAASMTAARDLATIVISDPNFGWVALTDWPAGSKTVCPSGPVPVLGINTILATCRSNLIVAQQLQNQEMITLAQNDIAAANKTVQTLQAACQASLTKKGPKQTDRNGVAVDAYRDAQTTLLSDLPAAVQHARLANFKLSLGWLSGPCTSGAAVVQPASLNDTPSNLVAPDGSYMAFVNIPVGAQSFYFAGLGHPTSLVPATQFQPADNVHISSAVRVDTAIDTGLTLNSLVARQGWMVYGAACAIPGANPDLTPSTVLALYVGGIPPANSLSSLLSGSQISTQLAQVDIAEGDAPSPGTLQPDPAYANMTAGQFAGKAIYDWLRSCHGREQIDKLINLLDAPLSGPYLNNWTYFTFNTDGTINAQEFADNPNPSNQVDDQQNQAVLAQISPPPALYIRDEVSRIGPSGGTHYGMPLPIGQTSNPISQMYPQNALAVEVQILN